MLRFIANWIWRIGGRPQPEALSSLHGDHEGDGHEIGEHDERDEADRLREPAPAPVASPFARQVFETMAPLAAGQVAVAVVNRVLTDEGVRNCAVKIGGVSATTNANGDATLSISGLADGEHDITIVAPDVSSDPVGPGFPANTNKDRIWRPLSGKVQVAGGRITAVVPPSDGLTITGTRLRAGLRPLWMKCSRFISPRTQPLNMITIHHTAGNLEGDLRTFLYTGAVSVHYVVGPNGHVYKLVDETMTAAHAGKTFWQGAMEMNSCSVGIEISHMTGVEYPTAQVDAVVDLVQRLKHAFPNISAGRVIGHSDIGISKEPPFKHGRKSTDPGSAFPWERIEALGLSFQLAPGTVKPGMYGGFFQAVPNGKLREGDNDGQHRYDGQVRPGISGAVREVQENLKSIGYLCPPDGDYGLTTSRAVEMFQQHMFSGSRRTGIPDAFNSGDGRFDRKTAEMLKRVLGDVDPAVA